MELKLKDREISITQERLQEIKKSAEKMQEEKDQLLTIIHRQTLLLEAPKPQVKASTKPRKTLATTKPIAKKTTAKKETATSRARVQEASAAKKTAKEKLEPKNRSKPSKKSR